MRQLEARSGGPGAERQQAAMAWACAETLASLPYGAPPTRFSPLPGGAPTWDDLAARAMFQCPRD